MVPGRRAPPWARSSGDENDLMYPSGLCGTFMKAVLRHFLFVAISLLALATSALNADERFAGLDEYVTAAMKKWKVPGLAIAVVKDGEVVLARGYGVSELGKERKVSANSVFTIASCTKSFTAACVGLLVEEGKLRWDDPVVRRLAEFELADAYLTKHLTLRDLLCHRTG